VYAVPVGLSSPTVDAVDAAGSMPQRSRAGDLVTDDEEVVAVRDVRSALRSLPGA
jgi:hypothetical protein